MVWRLLPLLCMNFLYWSLDAKGVHGHTTIRGTGEKYELSWSMNVMQLFRPYIAFAATACPSSERMCRLRGTRCNSFCVVLLEYHIHIAHSSQGR